jgi:hypothetical protein
VNTLVFTLVPSFTNKAFLPLVAVVVVLSAWPINTARADWQVDLSRRTKANREADLRASQAAMGQAETRGPAAVRAGDAVASTSTEDGAGNRTGFIDQLFDSGEPLQEMVVLNTEKGFVPTTLRVRKGGRYMIHVVNVNEKEKNVSFILDGFSEHHATYYGKIKSFRLEPKKEGVYSFQSPETSAEGKLVVFSPQMALPASVRGPASEGGK